MARSKQIGGTYRFTYPDYGTPDGFPGHTAHSGQRIKIVRKLSKEDAPVETMYEIEAADGWKGHAMASELRKVPELKRVKI
jgi:hypothetical protein